MFHFKALREKHHQEETISWDYDSAALRVWRTRGRECLGPWVCPQVLLFLTPEGQRSWLIFPTPCNRKCRLLLQLLISAVKMRGMIVLRLPIGKKSEQNLFPRLSASNTFCHLIPPNTPIQDILHSSQGLLIPLIQVSYLLLLFVQSWLWGRVSGACSDRPFWFLLFLLNL